MSLEHVAPAEAAWRGDQRLRVEVVFDRDQASLAAMWLVDGTVIQRPSLTGTLASLVSVDRELRLVQAFQDPRLVRAIARPDEIGHHFAVREEGRLILDVPLRRDQPAREIGITLVDIAKAALRPGDPGSFARLAQSGMQGVRVVGRWDMDSLTRHPDWPAIAKLVAIATPSQRPFSKPDRERVRSSGYEDDDQDEREGYSFVWWLHLPTKIIVAVRLDSAGRVEGAARPLADPELAGPAKGFQWNEEPLFTAAVERHRHEFRRLEAGDRRSAQHQRPEMTDDFEALGFR